MGTFESLHGSRNTTCYIQGLEAQNTKVITTELLNFFLLIKKTGAGGGYHYRADV
jgi:hypothetical protein